MQLNRYIIPDYFCLDEMNIKISRNCGTIPIVLISSLLIVVAVTVGIEPQEVTSQNATDVFTGMGETGSQNQTQEVTSQNATDVFTGMGETGSQNQTQIALANLTRADLGSVTSALDSARDSMLNFSSQDAYTFLNDADDALFQTATGEGPSATITIVEISEPIRNHIENAQNMLLAGDLPNALNERNLAEVELLKILQGLTAGEEEPPAEEEEPEEEEPPAEEEEPEEED
jgi:hypothetical protein